MKKIFKNFVNYYDLFKFDLRTISNKKIVNIGAGISYIKFAKNIDISKKAEISIDLNYEKLPFKDSSIDIIFSDHTIEHIKNYLNIIDEIYRVLKPGGCMVLCVPYLTLTKYNLVNPYHLNNFNEYSFDFFDKSKLKGSAAEKNDLDLRCINYYLSYIGLFRVLPFIRVVLKNYIFNVVRDIKFCIIKGDMASPLTKKISKNLPSVYRQFINSRINY